MKSLQMFENIEEIRQRDRGAVKELTEIKVSKYSKEDFLKSMKFNISPELLSRKLSLIHQVGQRGYCTAEDA